MVAVGDEERVLVDAHQCVPDGCIQVFTLNRVAVSNIVKHLNGLVDHDNPFHDWRRQQKNPLQVFFEPIDTSHAQLLLRVSCWRPDRLSGLIFPQSLDFANTSCKIAWQLTRRGTGDSSPLAATFDGFPL